jgi:electron transfer flavoprotein alpha subunit
MMEQSVIVIAEHYEGQIRPVTYELIACAAKLQQFRQLTIMVMILGDDVAGLAREIAETSGQDVVAVQVPTLDRYNGEAYKTLLQNLLIENMPTYICVAHTSQGLDFAPALAVVLDADCITGVEDVVEKDGNICVARPLYGGKIFAHHSTGAKTSILTIQPGIFKPLGSELQAPGAIDIKSMIYEPHQSVSLGLKQAAADTSGIAEARVVVAAGRGIREAENLEIIEQLAKVFPRSAVAGSRIVCDMGWLEYKCQVGVTGATVTPELYIACGISGAVQHVSGMRSSGFIVAINTDPAAAIFQVADICVVEDLTTFIPILIEMYEEVRNNN